MEVLVVVGIMTILAIAPFITLRTVNERVAFKDAQASILAALEGARGRAATGFGATISDHGVHIEGNTLTSFEGSTYIPGNGSETTLPPSVSVDSTSDTIIFSRLNVQTGTDTVINISQSSIGANSTITIQSNGAIILE